MTLKIYNKKRDFKRTAEPQGKKSKAHPHLYVIQKHAASHLHYDFRLELNGVLLSWAVPKGPCLDPTVRRLAMHVEDHPVAYGHFEGIIPKGQYGGGTVMLWDIGTWESLDEDPTKAYQKGHLHFILKGKKLKGGFHLIRFKKDDDKSWFLIKSHDRYAKALSDYDVTLKKPNSVLTKLTMEKIANKAEKIWTSNKAEKNPVKKKEKNNTPKLALKNLLEHATKSKMPSVISPELATLSHHAPQGENWYHELKFDGYRMLAFKSNQKIKLISRTQKDWTATFDNIKKALQQLKITHLILDGEIVLLNAKNQSDFQLLQNSIDEEIQAPFIYYIFDVLYYDKYNLLSLPLQIRKAILNTFIIATTDDTLRFSPHSIGNGHAIFTAACKMGLEGIVSKEASSTYIQRRTQDWLKTKCTKRQEFVIGGYTPPQGSRPYFGSLFLGVYKGKQLQFCGNVGTGFNDQSLQTISKQLQKLSTSVNPFSTKPPGSTTAKWVLPQLVAEVEFTEWTNDGRLRHPSFKGLRIDKRATDIIREKEGNKNG